MVVRFESKCTNVRKSCRSLQELSDEYLRNFLFANIGFDALENGTLNICHTLGNHFEKKLESTQAEADAASPVLAPRLRPPAHGATDDRDRRERGALQAVRRRSALGELRFPQHRRQPGDDDQRREDHA